MHQILQINFQKNQAARVSADISQIEACLYITTWKRNFCSSNFTIVEVTAMTNHPKQNKITRQNLQFTELGAV